MSRANQTRILVLLAAALAAGPAAGQGYKPSRPIELVTHTGPGGGGDIAARFLGIQTYR